MLKVFIIKVVEITHFCNTVRAGNCHNMRAFLAASIVHLESIKLGSMWLTIDGEIQTAR